MIKTRSLPCAGTGRRLAVCVICWNSSFGVVRPDLLFQRMMQKDALDQDMFLIGDAGPAKRLDMYYCWDTWGSLKRLVSNIHRDAGGWRMRGASCAAGSALHSRSHPIPPRGPRSSYTYD